MNPSTAEQVVSILLRAANDIGTTLDLVRASEPDEAFRRYSDALGKVMFVLDGVLRPIWIDHPDLKP